ncbi:MAG: sigma-70 family RNA polymerase sigma factor [Acidobacteriota bacterium]|nr:sigma-70 family RNA polymerase sigma factor [Acidobacteriota bacterium]
MPATRFPGPRAVAATAVLPGDERELWPLVAAGDRRAAEKLVELSYRNIFASLVKLAGGDTDLAADLTQETYRKAWASLGRFQGGARFSTWLYRIAYNTFVSHVRRPVPLSPLDDRQAEVLREPAGSQLDELGRLSDVRRVRRAVLELPEELRFAVTARYWAELPVTEIARLQKISQVGVRKRLKRALAQMAESLERPLKEETS